MTSQNKRTHVIAIATDLFRRFGFVATGVDRIVQESGVAKTTLYRYFPSKDELVLAVLSNQDSQFRSNLKNAMECAASDPKDRILAAFDFLEEWFCEENFNGCLFVCAAAEFDIRNHPARLVAIKHKKKMHALFRKLADAAGLSEPRRVADEIQILHEGAIAVAHVSGNACAAAAAKTIAARLLATDP